MLTKKPTTPWVSGRIRLEFVIPANVVLLRIPVQQRLQAVREDHEQCRAMLARAAGELSAISRVSSKDMDTAAS